MRRDPNRLDAVRVRAPAKINLHLRVGELRADGYHDLRTVFHAIDLYDEVRAFPAEQLELGLTGADSPSLPLDERNLAWRAAVALAERAEVPAAVRLELTKAIPIAAGLAGGSADAAATLVACDALWGTRMTRGDLLELAASLGADVAFALTGGTALGTGRGETLSPVLAVGGLFWVLAVAAGELSTPEVYRELDRLRADAPDGGLPPISDEAATLDALRAHDSAALGDALGNDLQIAALSLAPHLARTLQTGLELGALGAVVSGSGPTCAFLVEDRTRATQLAAALDAAGVCRTTRIATGPVHGARLVMP
jgi:4-diphosphocytidyl-2-C-methyl-D-erythritol kinase